MNRSIFFQVTAPAILTGLLLVGTCLSSAWSIHRLQANLAHILTENVAAVQASAELESRMRQLRYHCFLYLMKPSPEGLTQIEEDETDFQDSFDRARKASNTPQESVYLRQIEEGYREYRAEMARLRAEMGQHGPRPDFFHLANTHPIRQIVTPCQELGKLNRAQLEKTAEDSYQTSEHARLVLLLFAVGGPVGGVFCGYGLVRGLTRSLAKLQLRVTDVANRLLPPSSPFKPEEEIDLGAVTVDLDSIPARGDLSSLDQQLQHIRDRVEEVMARLQRQNHEIRRAEQLAALGQLAAGVAHEVRNPLTGMKLLVEAALSPNKRQTLTDEDLRVILGEITRLEQTVQHFLDFARPAALQCQTVDLREEVGRTVELLRPRARQQEAHLSITLPPQPVLVPLDRTQFGTVLVNLLVNALEAIPRGGQIQLTLGTRPSRNLGERGTCCLEIADSGTGISPQIANRLFTPFVSTKSTGTGLGLALSNTVVQEHGGRIQALNRSAAEGGGACFRITLPLAEPELSYSPNPPE